MSTGVKDKKDQDVCSFKMHESTWKDIDRARQ